MAKVNEQNPHILHKDGYRFHFWLEGKGRGQSVCCKAFKAKADKSAEGKTVYEDVACLDWVFGKIPGNNILGNAAIWIDQALLYAKNPPN